MSLRKTLLAATGIAALAHGTIASCYEPSTHEILSRIAADQSRIYSDPSLVADLGFSRNSTSFRQFDVNGVQVGTGDARTVVGIGARVEDYYHTQLCSLDWMRPFNHFFDPQHGGRGLQFGATIGHPSPAWVLEDQGEVTTILVPCKVASGRSQNFSYKNAQLDLYTALTAATAADREVAMSLVLQKLGHVSHHIQDMAQPQHTRNDTHSPLDPPEQPWFEYYTEQFAKGRIAGIVAANPYPIPNFARARDYWYTSGATGPAYVGMAEFTSNNYVSQGTGFASSGSTVLPNPNFPLPNGSGKTISQKTVTIQPRVGGQVTGPMSVVTGPIFDGFAFGQQGGKTLATMSLLDRLLVDSGHTRLYSVSSVVFEDQYPTLLPRAVAFSAGLINHFFAGRLGLRRTSSNNGWLIDNLGADALNGSFQLFYETSAGQRTLVSGGVWSGTLQPGQSTAALPEPPAATAKLVAVFSGLIGSETMSRTAGKVVNYLPPPIPCGNPVSAAGSSNGTTVVQELGTQPGPVQVEFEAYQIPDAYEIRQVRPDNSLGATLVTTNGQVSGWHTWTFQHDPLASGTTRVRVRVTGNTDPNTLWTTTVSCPGQSLSNGNRPQPRIGISFFKGGVSGSGCPTGFTDVFLNGAKVGRLTFNQFGGGSSFSTTVTTGIRQFYSLQTTNTSFGSPGAPCGGDGRIYYQDRSGQHFLLQNSGWIGIQ